MSSARRSRDSATAPAFVPPLAAVAGIVYSSWVLQFLINPHLDAVNGYVSELSATDQPYHGFFSGCDFLAGAVSIAVAALVVRRFRPRGWALGGWLALLLFGAFSIGDSLLAMDCAPNSDPTCALRERAGTVSFAHEFHSVTSTLVVMSGIVSLIALTIAARRYGRWPVLARWSWPVMVVETTAALATLPLMYFGLALGVMERIQVTVISVWLFVIATELYTGRRRARAAGRIVTRPVRPAGDGSPTAVRERAASP
ncbi:DUF998 domain-containing protein [Actinoallomurus purpureus]|uniref:DUF998 domain-containing protein n=1 Tax=Actinoallomurus purpureus TaxID=478114 RepID=UPI00209385C1|nr:DUF998 domain-containing protein [Actinoallomurus purpureus]MCO6011192.1 DUF998 domain-containing protein [Actinoallomurus purpureus]